MLRRDTERGQTVGARQRCQRLPQLPLSYPLETFLQSPRYSRRRETSILLPTPCATPHEAPLLPLRLFVLAWAGGNDKLDWWRWCAGGGGGCSHECIVSSIKSPSPHMKHFLDVELSGGTLSWAGCRLRKMHHGFDSAASSLVVAQQPTMNRWAWHVVVRQAVDVG